MLLKNADILREDFSVDENCYLLTDGAYIAYVGHERPAGEHGEELNCTGRLIMPAFYNAHSHSPMTLMRGYGENLRLWDWLRTKIFPFEDKMEGRDFYYGTLLAMAESFASGIACSTEMYFSPYDILEAVTECGAKMNYSRALVADEKYPDPRLDPRVAEVRRVHEEMNGSAEGRILTELSLHGEYATSQALGETMAELVAEYALPIHVHISETSGEHEEGKARRGGLTPTAFLDSLGIFAYGGTAAHCIYVDENDAEILAKRGVSAATCPSSNLKLASGIINTPLLAEKAVRIAIGTDSVAANNSLSMFEEMKLYALLAKERYGNPELITPAEALYAATRAGALTMRRDDCGIIAEGMRADFIAIDMTAPEMSPVYELATALVYSAGNALIRMTVVDGRVVYENGEFPTIDIERVTFEARSRAKAIVGRIV